MRTAKPGGRKTRKLRPGAAIGDCGADVKSPGAADPESIGAIELGPFGVYTGEAQ